MIATSNSGLSLEVDRGPDWIFIRVQGCDPKFSAAPPLAEAVWAILEQNFVYRVVLEMDRIAVLHSYLVGQLVLLTKRLHGHDGVLRICGLSPDNQAVLGSCQLDGIFPNYRDRSDAVMCSRPSQPR